MIISLTGFMGCGKSSVGSRLSQLLCCRFMDLDSVIEAREGRSIPEIFASDGEAAFRSMELESIRTILDDFCQVRLRKPCYPSGRRGRGPSLAMGGIVSVASPGRNPDNEMLVLALGGGTVMTPECAEMVRDNTLCIYLRVSLETLVAHLESEASDRPLLSGTSLRDRISELMALRSATYENTAHVIIDIDGRSIDSIAQEIMQRIHISF